MVSVIATASEVVDVDCEDGSRLPAVFVHRGCALKASETLAAFKEAHKKNVDGVVFDLAFTRDHVAVVFNDDTVERTTNGARQINNITFEQLRSLHASSKHDLAERFPHQSVPTLLEGVEECVRVNMRIVIRVTHEFSRSIKVLDEMFRDRPELYRRAMVASSDPSFVYLLRCANEKIVTGLMWRPGVVAYEDWDNTMPRHREFHLRIMDNVADWLLDQSLQTGILTYVTGASVVIISRDLMSMDYVKTWQDRGLHVMTWMPNDPNEKDYFRKRLNVTVITDCMQPI
ncbi:hypothetical protein MTO96_041757 [Rhipicephalus appendiculatus]